METRQPEQRTPRCLKTKGWAEFKSYCKRHLATKPIALDTVLSMIAIVLHVKNDKQRHAVGQPYFGREDGDVNKRTTRGAAGAAAPE